MSDQSVLQQLEVRAGQDDRTLGAPSGRSNLRSSSTHFGEELGVKSFANGRLKRVELQTTMDTIRRSIPR